MTHKELVQRAAQQLKSWRCLPVLCELVTYNSSGEIPDAIGWTSRDSILFECKTSRSDFLRDKKKLFRVDLADCGVGDFRFYLTNPGVIKAQDELPEGWGCYEVINGKLKHRFGVKYANAAQSPFSGNKRNEVSLLRSYIRRKEQ